MSVEHLIARLERVERANQRMRAAGIAALVLVAAVVAMGQAAPTPKVIQAERFEVQDRGGKTRACLGSDADGSPTLSLRDRDGKERLVLAVLPNGSAGLSLLDKDGEDRVGLCLLPGGSPGLTLDGTNGNSRAGIAMGVLPDGSAALSLRDKDCKERMGLGVLPDGSPQLTLFDEGGKPRAALGMTDFDMTRTAATKRPGLSSLVLFDKDGKVIFRAPEK